MKTNTIVLFFAFILITSSGLLYSQTEPPSPPSGELAPMFEDFQEMAKANEVKILKNIPADVKEDLLKVKKIDEDEYYNILSEAPHFYFDFEEAFIFDPVEKNRMKQSQQVDYLEMQTEALGFLYQHSKPGEQPQIKNKLQIKLEQLFGLKEEERRIEVEMLEKELKELKASLDVRKKNKVKIINHRLNELIGMDDYLEWD